MSKQDKTSEHRLSKPSNQSPLSDAFRRPLRDLRISVTDRCNFRCTYCMPREVFGPDFAFLPHEDLLTFEEIARLARVFVRAGVHKLRITGGEPLLRRDLPELIAMLAEIQGVEDIALTTNGSTLTPSRAKQLAEAGLKRVTVSLDSLRDEVFMALNDVRFPVRKVLEAIEAAAEAGLSPVKINMVVKRGGNEEDILPMAEYFRGTPHVLRFIEYMDVGNSNGWQMRDVVSADTILNRIAEQWPLRPLDTPEHGQVAQRYVYEDGQGEIGVIASVTRPFCGGCTRARLSPEGELYTCLFGTRGYDFRERLRRGDSDEELFGYLASIWGVREDRYSELRSAATSDAEAVGDPDDPAHTDDESTDVTADEAELRRRRKVEMSHIGG